MLNADCAAFGPSMWPNWKDRALEILQYADLFERETYLSTAKWLHHLATLFGDKKPVTDLEGDLEEVRRSFRSEFSEGGPSYTQVIKFVEPVVTFHYTRPVEEQQKYQAIFQALAGNAQNLKAIDDAFKGFPPGRTRFYGKCLLYLVNAEGMFDEAITFLYGLFRDFIHKPLSVEDLHMTQFETIRARLLVADAPAALFEGLDNHVRNAIAHSRFVYNKATGIMTFQDRNLKTRKVWPAQLFSAHQFDELYRKLDNPWHAISHLVCLWRVTDLVVRSNVRQAGKLAPIGQAME